jgi:hypothetical protein
MSFGEGKKESNSFNFHSMQSLEVFLYRSPELPYPVLREVCDLMQTIKGPLKFKMLEKEESREVATKSNPKSLRVKSWKQLFEEVSQYRSHHNIQQAFMVFQLTNHPNEYGFYAAVDEKTKSLSLSIVLIKIFFQIAQYVILLPLILLLCYY